MPPREAPLQPGLLRARVLVSWDRSAPLSESRWAGGGDILIKGASGALIGAQGRDGVVEAVVQVVWHCDRVSILLQGLRGW